MSDTREHKKSGERYFETDVLIKVARVANSTLNLQEILDTITRIIAESLDKEVCSIYLLKPGKKICLEATKGLKQDAIGRVCLPLGEGIVGWVARELRPLAVKNITKEPRFIDIPVTGASDFLSMLAVPIVRDKDFMGVITLQTRAAYTYSTDDIDLLTLIAHYVSASIQNAELYRSVKTQLDELRSIHELGKAITSILSMDKLLPYICEQVTKLFNTKGCILRLIEEDTLQIKASFGLPDRIKNAMNLRIGEGIAGHVAKEGSPLLIDDAAKMPVNLRVPLIETTSVLCVPLKIGERVIGTLGLYDKKNEWGITTFTRQDLETISTFASAASVAIENARLYKLEVEKEKKILSLYWEVAQTKDYLESLIENSADAIIISDTGGLITSWNRSAEIIYGYSEDDVMGTFLPMVPLNLMDKEKENIRKILQGETIKNIETVRQTKDGRMIEISLTLSPVLDSSGNVTGISGISRDITEKKRVEKELIRKNQELSRMFFISSVVRSTLDLDKLLRIVLTVVTMSDGLGFNRAMLFLVDDQQKTLRGVMGIGPENPEEAGDIWLSLEGKTLESIIDEIEHNPHSRDSYLDRLSQDLVIPLDSGCILTRCIHEKKPFNVPDARLDPLTPPLLIQIFGTAAYGVVPLIIRDKAIGVAYVDNHFTGKQLNEEDLQFLMGFTSHVASAIENAKLFEDVSLAQSELKNIFESISDMVYYTDSDFNIININQSVIEKIGRPAEEIVGKKCFEVFHGQDRPSETCPHAKAIKTGKASVGEIQDTHLGGTFVISSSPIFDSTGEFTGTVNVSRDISELHDLRERVHSTERMAALGEMAARVAHEIRNPLISVGGFARRLEKKLDGELHDHAMIIVEEVQRLENILKEILSFVRGIKTVKFRSDLNELVENSINLIREEIEGKGNRLIENLSPSPITANVDSDKIKEAILNIIKNANEATESGTITVRTGKKDREAVIEISDDGCGIKKEDLKEIFTPFYTSMPYGTGLGLAITDRIVQEHQGKIDVKSTCSDTGTDNSGEANEKGGTTFIIYLPLDET
jgi:PAS domain S-box-containing protein